MENCCQSRGLFFSWDVKLCRKHQDEAQRDLVIRTNERAKGIVPPGDPGYGPDWPYGPNIDVEGRVAMLNWAEEKGVRLVHRSYLCLRWLSLGYCKRTSNCRETLSNHRSLGSWVDHLTAWVRASDNRPAAIVSQPYGRHDGEALSRTFANHGLRSEVDPNGGWYGHGTTFIGIWAD